MERIKALFRITDWIGTYDLTEARADVVAGVTVGVMLIPQSMAYATLAGMPPVYGLYASIVPLLTYPIFGTSHSLAVGTVAIDMVLVAAGLGELAPRSSAEYIQLAILLTLMVGILQILMGAVRLGFIVNLLSRPVIAGFVTAAPLIIATSQLGNLFGFALPQAQRIYVLVQEVWVRLGDISYAAAGIGLVAMVFILGLKRWKPLFPAALLAVLMGIIGGSWVDLSARGVDIVGQIPSGLPTPTFPMIEWSAIRDLLPTAVTLALVQFMKNVSLAKVFTSDDDPDFDANGELIALGMANLMGSFFRSLPISGSFSRTAVNTHAGARTPLANAVAAGLVAVTVLFLTPLFRVLPMPILAAIVIVACFNLINIAELKYLVNTKRRDGAIALLTLICVLFIGIQEGILIGIGASVMAVLYRISRPNVVELGHVPGTHQFRDVNRFPEAETIQGIFIIRMDASFSFANAEYLKNQLLAAGKSQGTPIRALILDCSSVNDLDTTAAGVIGEVVDMLKDQDIELYFVGATGPVRETFVRSGLKDKVGEDHFFLSPHRAVRHILSRWDEQHRYEAMEDEQEYGKEEEVFKEADADR